MTPTDKTICVLCGHAILENAPRSEFTEGAFCSDSAGCRRRALTRLTTVTNALRNLHAEVEMAESIGICLPDRVPSLTAGAVLIDANERQ